MSGELGLQNTFHERVYVPLQAYRDRNDCPNRDITTFDFMSDVLGMTNTVSRPIEEVDIFCDMGLDPNYATIDAIMTVPGTDYKWLIPEYFQHYIVEGMNENQTHLDLCARTIDVKSRTVVTPYIKAVDATPEQVKETETFPIGSMTWRDKSITLAKIAQGLEISDELRQECPLPLIRIYMNDVGRMYGIVWLSMGVSVIINGDQKSGSNVIGVKYGEVVDTLSEKDHKRIWARGGRIGMKYDHLITNEDEAFAIMDWDIYSKFEQGSSRVKINRKHSVIPDVVNQFEVGTVSDGVHVFFDKRYAMVYFRLRPLKVEADRFIMRQVNQIAFSMSGGFGNILDHARVAANADATKTFVSQGWPEIYKPLI